MLNDKILEFNIVEIRFVVAILLTLLFCMTFKERQSIAQTLCALLLLYITFDYLQMSYFLIAILINLVCLCMFGFKEYTLTAINFLILYIFKLKGKQFYPYIHGTCDISGIIMLLTQKMSYLGRDYDSKKHTVLDAIGYLSFIPGFILGPTTTFIEFVETPHSKHTLSSIPTFFHAFCFLILLKIGEKYFPASILFEKDINFGTRLLYLYLYNLGQRCRFYFAWHYSNGCYILQGFNNMLNINFFKVETATSIKDLTDGWNIKTNKWLKECYFDKLKHKNVFLASLVTFTVSALWHGIKPGYLVMFLSFCFAIPVLKSINKIVKNTVPILFPIFSRIQMLFFVMYFSVPFFLLELDPIYKIWSSLYFFGHVYCFFAFNLHFLHSL